MLQEARQQHLVEVGVLDADHGLVGATQAAPVQHRVAGRDVERPGDAGAGLLDAREERLRLREHAATADLLGEGGEAPGGLGRLGDERAAAGDALEQALGDERVERLAHRHPGHAEAGDELALGRGRGAGRLRLDEAADVLADLDVLQRPLPRYDDVRLVHTSKDRTGLDRCPQLTDSVVKP